jgi:ribosomal protein L18E
VPGAGHPYEELIDHLTHTSALSEREAARVVADVLTYFSEPTEAYVRRRHAELKARSGLTNDEIFQRIAAELPGRRVAPPELSLRQLRRMVYG